jgi:anti-sigma regulatory factor (Ser/Thr protein kinase)
MAPNLENLKIELQRQAEELTNAVRHHEAQLMISKERFLKVQGALEMLEIVSKDYGKKTETENPDEAIPAKSDA